MNTATALSIRRLSDMDDLIRCCSIEQAVWGEGIVPPHLLRAVTDMGGLTVGAFMGTELVGFVFGFLGRLESAGRSLLTHHSHVLAVLPHYGGQGIGTALKMAQAEFCRQQGLELMTWTFDPLRARNAHLNIERLGATVNVYAPKHYGQMFDSQNGQLDSDRLLAEWQLTRAPERFQGDAAGLPRALARLEDGSPGEPQLELMAAALHVAVPRDLDELLAGQPLLAARWRESVREVMAHYLNQGYRATRFLAGGYVLEPG